MFIVFYKVLLIRVFTVSDVPAESGAAMIELIKSRHLEVDNDLYLL